MNKSALHIKKMLAKPIENRVRTAQNALPATTRSGRIKKGLYTALTLFIGLSFSLVLVVEIIKIMTQLNIDIGQKDDFLLITNAIGWGIFGLTITVVLTAVVFRQGRRRQHEKVSARDHFFAITLFLGALLSLLLFQLLDHDHHATVKKKFDVSALEHAKAIRSAIDKRLEILEILKAFHDASAHINPTEFKLFVTNFSKRYSDIHSIQWSPHVMNKDREYFENKLPIFRNKRSVISVFSSRRATVTRSVNAQYLPIQYVVPSIYRPYLIGQDLRSFDGYQPHNAGINYVVSPSVSGAFKLVKGAFGSIEKIKTDPVDTGVLLSIPVFKTAINAAENDVSHFMGVYSITLNVASLVEEILHQDVFPTGVDIMISERVADTNELALVYSSSSKAMKAEVDNFIFSQQVKMGGRTWVIDVSSRYSEQFPQRSFMSILIPILSMMFTLGAAFYFWRSARYKAKMTRLFSNIESKEKMQEAMIESIPDPLLAMDIQGNIQFVNMEMSLIFGYSEPQLIGQHVSLLAPPYLHKIFKHYLKHYMASPNKLTLGGVGGEIQARRRNGELFPVEININPLLEEGDNTLIMVIFSDITERKDILASLEVAKDKAEASTLAKSEFLSKMSHEIRTPMHAIMGISQLALKTELTLKQTSYIEKVYEASERLMLLINDLLDFSKMEAGKEVLNVEPFYLSDVVSSVNTIMQIQAEEKKITFTSKIDLDVVNDLLGDSNKIRQIMINLCNNAIKFTPYEGDVSLRVKQRTLTHKTVMLECSVKDNGIGISDSDQQKLFNSFVQADNTHEREFQGTGLGLAISKGLAELMGGDTRLESAVGKGSTFYFSVLVDVQ